MVLWASAVAVAVAVAVSVAVLAATGTGPARIAVVGGRLTISVWDLVEGKPAEGRADTAAGLEATDTRAALRLAEDGLVVVSPLPVEAEGERIHTGTRG